jgi:hypothetical protein
MHRLSCLGLCMLASACMQPEAKVAPESTPTPAKVVNSDCYTVDLFTEVKVEKPAKGVPAKYRRFLGKWGGGAWNNVWCHDLLVNKVEADGRVELVEMHAPYEPWHQPPTAFRRVAQIDEDGNLHLDYGTERVVYRIENGKLIGTRHGVLGNLHIELKRRGVPPIPAPKPMRLAQLGTAQRPGS